MFRIYSHLCFVIPLANGQNRASIVHYGANWYLRLSRSVLVVEVPAISYAFDKCLVTQEALNNLRACGLHVEAFKDSCTLLQVIG